MNEPTSHWVKNGKIVLVLSTFSLVELNFFAWMQEKNKRFVILSFSTSCRKSPI